MSNEEMVQMIKAGDDGYLPQLWEQIRKLVAIKAQRFHSKLNGWRGVDVDDLIQVGYFGLLDAIKYYEPARGFKFTTYLNMTLKNAFREAVGLRSSKADLLFACISLDDPLRTEDGDLSLLDALEDCTALEQFDGVEESEYTRQLRAVLDNALGLLEDTDRRVMEQYYYFGLSFYQIAAITGTSTSNIAERHRKSLTRIRRSSHRRKLEPFMFWFADNGCYEATGHATWARSMDTWI